MSFSGSIVWLKFEANVVWFIITAASGGHIFVAIFVDFFLVLIVFFIELARLSLDAPSCHCLIIIFLYDSTV